MAELRIFDSQGSPIRSEEGTVNQMIKDFFFDGVRFAIDENQNQIYCFFRARDNETARSEQYYAMYKYRSRSEMRQIVSEVKTRIEDEYNMVLDMNNQDTRFFQLLSSSDSGSPPRDSNTIQDISELLSDYHKARLGVGSYDEAYALFSNYFSNKGVATIAVSDNAHGSSISSYDLVIEKGNYTGLEPLGDTADAVEELREERRAVFETDDGDDDGLSLSGLKGALLFGGVGVVLLVSLVGALYGGCIFLDMSTPVINNPPGIDNCVEQTNSSPVLVDVSAEVTGNNSQQLRVYGNLSNESRMNAPFNVTVRNETGKIVTNTSNQSVANDTFDFTIPIEDLSLGSYNARIKYANSTRDPEFEIMVVIATPTPSPTSNSIETDTVPPAQLASKQQ